MLLQKIKEECSTTFQKLSIPAKPELLIDLQTELDKKDRDINKISKIINYDPALSLEILKTVNSAYFGFAQKIISVSHAISLIGVNATVNIFTYYLLRHSMKNAHNHFPRFWDESSLIAHVCAFLAKELSIKDKDRAYALGLFHNFGIPLMGLNFKGFLNVLKEENARIDGLFTDLEDAEFEINHAQVAAMISSEWGFDPSIINVILHHHNVPMMLDSDDFSADQKSLLCLLKVAEHIVSKIREEKVDPDWEKFKNIVLVNLNLSEEKLNHLVGMFMNQKDYGN